MSTVAAVFVICVVLFLYALAHYYIGRRGWRVLDSLNVRLRKKVYWTGIWILALSFPAGELGQRFLPEPAAHWVALFGFYWLPGMMYFFMLLVVIDLVNLCDKKAGFMPARIKQHPRAAPVTGLVVLGLVLGILLYGTWNARHPVINRYTLNVAKSAGSISRLHVVMVSDIHLGEVVNNGRLHYMVNMVNKLQPDIVLLPGDVIDENTRPFVEQGMSKTLRQLKTKYGVYAVPGNHDNGIEMVRCLQSAGIRVLRESYVKVADSFYVVGRDDENEHGSVAYAGNKPEAKLADLLVGIDKSLPVIVMDHQPNRLEEAQANGVDLELSGHTHRGQFFPNQLVTRWMYEIDWGLLSKGNFHVVVSKGYGTWGPPIRVGNAPEVVDITVNFTGTRK